MKCLKAIQKDSNREVNLAFLYKIARNHYIDGKRRKSEVLVDETENFAGSTNIAEWESLLEILFCKLPLRQAMLLTLKDVFQFSSKEIAQMLRMSNESIKTSLHRIRKNLRESEDGSTIHSPLDSMVSIKKLSLAIKAEDPYKIFYYYRLLESENFKIRGRHNNSTTFFLSDPDGNILQIGSS